ncbi:IS3 family transposase [Pendulispora brunnea]|uniref:IS3 family transposase n=1 Tax=Pendulispora brunnea TaxID=2905690 RepID=A0ABZ2KG93_9BACT
MPKRKRRVFTPQFKAEAVRLCKVGDRTIGQVAKDLDLTETALRAWIKRAETDAGDAPKESLSTAERDELTELRRKVKRLEMERDILKKANGLLREGIDVRFAFVHEEKASYPIAVLCKVLGVSRSGYYAWASRPTPSRERSDAQLAVEIATTHKRSRDTYGSPRVHRDLRARGIRVGKKRVERLMREHGIFAKRRRRFRRTTDSRHSYPIAPNVLARRFEAAVPNRAWVTDVTYVWTLEGWLYLAVILDLCSRRIVGWAASENNDRHLANDALRRAVANRRPVAGLLHHSDRGSPYASDDYRNAIAANGMIASMSRRGNCWDNAVAESFFATLKGELLDHEVYQTRRSAVAAIGDYIDAFYNLERRHSSIDYVSPIEFELKIEMKRVRTEAA